MSKRWRLWIVSGLVSVTVVVAAMTLSSTGFSVTSQRQEQIFNGVDDKGDFQKALNDAVAKAQQAAGCCDIRVSYKVIGIEGQVGGFAPLNQVKVTVWASW